MNLISKQDSKLKAENCQLGCHGPRVRHALWRSDEPVFYRVQHSLMGR